MGRRGTVDGRAATTAGLVVVLSYLLLTAGLALAAGTLGELLGTGPAGTATAGTRAVAVTTSALAVVSWAAAGWAGTRAPRRRGAPRSLTTASAALGATTGYLVLPGLVGILGLVLAGAPAVDVLAGPLLSALLAGAVAGLAALAARHAPAPAPYTG